MPRSRAMASSTGSSGPSFSSSASRTVSTTTCVLRSISMCTASPACLSPKVVMRSVSGMSHTSNQPEPSRSRRASATVRLQPLTPT